MRNAIKTLTRQYKVVDVLSMEGRDYCGCPRISTSFHHIFLLVNLIMVANIYEGDVIVLYDYLQHDAITHGNGNGRQAAEPAL